MQVRFREMKVLTSEVNWLDQANVWCYYGLQLKRV